MSMDQRVFWLVVTILLASVLLKNPKCKHGCRTLLEHILDYELQGVLKGLFA